MIAREIRRLRNAWFYSLDGLRVAWKDAGAFRLEVVLTPFVVAIAFYLAHDGAALALLLGSWLLLLIVELLNTAIEALTDLAADGRIHGHAKKAKDCASAAVLLVCALCVLTWSCVLLR